MNKLGSTRAKSAFVAISKVAMAAVEQVCEALDDCLIVA